MTTKRPTKKAPAEAGAQTADAALGFDRGSVFDHADDEMRRMLHLAKHGDKEAAERLHAMLVNRMEHGALTEWDWDLMTQMHRDIANGADARVATLTMPPSNRRTTAFRDREMFIRIFMWIETQSVLRGSPATIKDACEAIAPKFDISPKTAKSIYLRVRKSYAVEA